MRITLLPLLAVFSLSLGSCSDQLETETWSLPGNSGTCIIYEKLGEDGHEGSSTIQRLSSDGTSQLVDSSRTLYGVGKNTVVWLKRFPHDLIIGDSNGHELRRIAQSGQILAEQSAVSPDGSYICYVTFNSLPSYAPKLIVESRDGATSKVLDSNVAYYAMIAFTPDNRSILYYHLDSATGKGLYKVDIATGVRTLVTSISKVNNGFVDVSKDGVVAYSEEGSSDQDHTLYLVNLDGTGKRKIGPGWMAHWSPDGKKLAYSDLTNLVVSFDEGGTFQKVVTGSQWIFMPSWSPDGTRILYGKAEQNSTVTTNPNLYEFNVRTSQEKLLAPGGIYGYYLR